jgi:hypothetical protein
MPMKASITGTTYTLKQETTAIAGLSIAEQQLYLLLQ